jgi:hypothetical protein
MTDFPATDPDGRTTGGRAARGTWWIWLVLAVWLVLGALAPNEIAGSWHFVVTGVDVLFRSTGGPWSSLYAAHPDVQMGPVTFLVAAPFVLAGGAGSGKSAATVAMTATGFVLFAVVVALARRHDGRDRRSGEAVEPPPAQLPAVTRFAVLVGGLLFLAGWVEVGTRAGHLDDILALVFTVAALGTRLRTSDQRHHSLSTALLLALAVDSKPWAIAFVPLLLDLTVSLRRNAAAVGVWLVVVAAAWGPFALADHATLNASHFTIPTDASSGLRALGIAGGNTPTWDRPAQALIGAALGVVAILLRRPAAVPLVGMAVRIAIDPGVHPYYNSGLLLTTVIVDLVLLRRRVPWLTVAAFALIEVAHYGLVSPDLIGSAGPHLAGYLRVATCALLCLAALVAPARRLRDHRPQLPAPRTRTAAVRPS